jgi:uncharacterized membrane-anchored protein YitT (DUF2179 family)
MKEKIKFVLSVLLGNALLAFSICAFVVPNGIILGGSNGIALFLHQFLPNVPLAVIAAAINITLFLLGLAFMGWKFAATSLLSTLIYPLILGLFEVLPISTMFNENIVVSALACGVLCGLGIGLVMRSGGSTGGMDIPPCILNKYTGIPIGTSVMVFDTLVVLMQVFVQGLDGLFLSILVIVVMSFTIDRTILFGDKKIQIIIISPEVQNIRQEILQNIDCGVTMLEIEGGHDGQKQQAILSVVYSAKYEAVRNAALKFDKNAFIISSDVTNVNGQGYTIDRNYRK